MRGKEPISFILDEFGDEQKADLERSSVEYIPRFNPGDEIYREGFMFELLEIERGEMGAPVYKLKLIRDNVFWKAGKEVRIHAVLVDKSFLFCNEKEK